MGTNVITTLGNGSRQAIVGAVAVGVAVALKSPGWGMLAHTAVSALASKFIDGEPVLASGIAAAPGAGAGTLSLFSPLG